MPTIPMYQSQTRAPAAQPKGQKLGRVDVSSGLVKMGEAVGQTGDVLTRVQNDTDIADANAAFVDFQKDYIAGKAEYDKTNSTGQDYTKDLMDEYNKKASQYAENLTPGARNKLSSLTEQMSVAALAKNMEGEAEKKASHKTAQTMRVAEGVAELVNDDPTQLAAQWEVVDDMINSMSFLAEDKKELVRNDLKQKMGMAAAYGEIDEDPQGFLDNVEAGKYDEYLTVQEKEGAKGIAEAQIKHNQLEAKRELVEQKAVTMERFSHELNILTMGLNAGVLGPNDLIKFISQWDGVLETHPALRALMKHLQPEKGMTPEVYDETQLRAAYAKGEIDAETYAAEIEAYEARYQTDKGQLGYFRMLQDLPQPEKGMTPEVYDEVQLRAAHAKGEITDEEYAAEIEAYEARYQTDKGLRGYLRMIQELSQGGNKRAKEAQSLTNVYQAYGDPRSTLDHTDSNVKAAVDTVYKLLAAKEDPANLTRFSVDFMERVGVVPKSILDSIRFANNPVARIGAAVATVQILGSASPVLSQQIDSESISLARQLQAAQSRGLDPEQAIAHVDTMRKIDPTVLKERDEEAKNRFETTNKKEYDEALTKVIKKYIDDNHPKLEYGWLNSTPAMKRDFKSVIDKNYVEEYRKMGEKEPALKAAMDLALKRFGVSRFGGMEPTFVRDAPELHYSLAILSAKDNSEWMTEQALLDVKNSLATNDDTDDDNLEIDPKSLRLNVTGTRNGNPVYQVFFNFKDGSQSTLDRWVPEFKTSSAYAEMEKEEAEARAEELKEQEEAVAAATAKREAAIIRLGLTPKDKAKEKARNDEVMAEQAKRKAEIDKKVADKQAMQKAGPLKKLTPMNGSVVQSTTYGGK